LTIARLTSRAIRWHAGREWHSSVVSGRVGEVARLVDDGALARAVPELAAAHPRVVHRHHGGHRRGRQ
jgi:hypothetical protein